MHKFSQANWMIEASYLQSGKAGEDAVLVSLQLLVHCGSSTAARLRQYRSFEDEQGCFEPVNERS